jgi:serine/threonine-protein kinase RsbW
MTEDHHAAGPRALISLCFPAQDHAVRHALLRIDTALQTKGVDRDLRHRAQIALAEACNNIVEHAYPFDTTGDALIVIDVAGDRGGLQIALRDRGGAMPGGQMPGDDLPSLDLNDPLALPEGGFGWPILRRMTRAISLSRDNGQNILRFRLPAIEVSGHTGQNAL